MPTLPDWSRELVDLYESNATTQFILHGNVNDRVLLPSKDGAKLVQAVATLDTRDQLLLVLRYEDGLGPQRIAGMLGFPTRFHVHRRLKRVLAALKSELETRGFDGP